MSSLLVRKNRNISKSGDLFLAIVLVCSVIGVLGWWIASSYFNIDAQASFSYRGDDGHCESARQGLGIHCFGDYYYAAIISDTANPWDRSYGINPYPAISILPFKFFEGMSDFTGAPRLGLSLYMLLIFVALCSAAIWSSLGFRSLQKAVIFVAIGPAAVTALIALDRGNSAGALVPVLLWFAVSVLRENRKQSVLALVLLSVIKPHFCLLVLALIANRWWRSTVYSIGIIFFLQISSFLFWPSFFPESIQQSIVALLDFRDYVSIVAEYPTQISFAHGLATIEQSVKSILFSSNSESSLLSVGAKNEVGLFILAFVALSVTLFPERFPSDLRMFLLIASITFSPTVVWPYYGVVAQVIGALILRPAVREELRIEDKRDNKSYRTIKVSRSSAQFLVILATAFSLVRLPLPRRISGSAELISTTSSMSAVLWLLVVASVTLLALSGNLQGRLLFDEDWKSEKAISKARLSESI